MEIMKKMAKIVDDQNKNDGAILDLEEVAMK